MNIKSYNPFIFLGLMSLLFLSCKEKKQEHSTSQKPSIITQTKVTTQSLTPKDFHSEHIYFGNISPTKTATLTSYSGGYVQKIKIQEGQYVRKGQSLCSIDSELKSASYSHKKHLYELSEKTLNDLKVQIKSGFASQQMLDEAKLKYYQAKTELLKATKDYNTSRCIAPISGTVTSQKIKAHQTILPGSETFQIASLKEFELTFGIPEKDLSSISEGNKAIVKLFNGSIQDTIPIHKISMTQHPTHKTYVGTVKIKHRKGLRTGFTAEVIVKGTPLKNQKVIPMELILKDNIHNYVFINKNNKAQRIPLNIVSFNSSHAVVEGSLTFGDSLIVEGFEQLTSNTPVVATHSKSSPNNAVTRTKTSNQAIQ